MADNHRISGVPATATNRLKEIAEFVGNCSHICIPPSIRCPHPRYINLRTQQIFDNLVDLYSYVFATRWHRYTDSMELLTPSPTGVPLHVYAARCYISMWFIDLYVSNRNAVYNLWSVASYERYQGKLSQTCHEYDDYLALLNASIRPTCVKDDLDDALYIPVLADSVDFNESNPFGINNFTPKDVCFKFGVIMNRVSFGHSSLDSNEATGRPWWLFDWHSDKHACSWFPSEGNYGLEDVSLAYILGTACTENLGPKDVDEWQYFGEGVVPKSPDPLKYDRMAERGFFGSHEVRTMEIDADFSLKRAFPAAVAEGSSDRSGEDAQEDYPLTPRFRLIDWCYHHKVIFNVDNQLRVRMHTQFISNLPESVC